MTLSQKYSTVWAPPHNKSLNINRNIHLKGKMHQQIVRAGSSSLSLLVTAGVFPISTSTLLTLAAPALRVSSEEPSTDTSSCMAILGGKSTLERRRLTWTNIPCIVHKWTVLHCTLLPYTAARCTLMRCSKIHQTVYYYTVYHCTVLYCAVLHCIVISALYSSVQSTVLYCSARCFTALYFQGTPKQFDSGGEIQIWMVVCFGLFFQFLCHMPQRNWILFSILFVALSHCDKDLFCWSHWVTATNRF